MVAERTDEHDSLFEDGREYVGFSTSDELVGAVRSLIDDEERRRQVAVAARSRCLKDGYSTIHRAKEMLAIIESIGFRSGAAAS